MGAYGVLSGNRELSLAELGIETAEVVFEGQSDSVAAMRANPVVCEYEYPEYLVYRRESCPPASVSVDSIKA